MESKEAVEGHLRALEERLRFTKAPPIELVVCGGSGLFVQNLMTRTTTKDVDVLAEVKRDADGRGLLVKLKPLPEFLRRQAAIVAGDFGLPDDWINDGPADLIDSGLPEGLLERLHRVVYGPNLAVHYLDRLDQIHLKLFATVNGGPTGRHMADLIALKATAAEVEAAAKWSLDQDSSEGYVIILKDCLRALGHDDVARRL